MSRNTHNYEPVAGEEEWKQDDSSLEKSHIHTTKSRWLSWPALACLLIVSNTLTLAGGYYCWNLPRTPRSSDNAPPNAPSFEPLQDTWETFWWNTPYNSMENTTETDMLWDSILPSHGIIALDREQAGKQNLPDSMYLPSDHTKGVYLLESYHYLHCLKILRTTLTEAVEGKPFTHHPGAHSNHCFGALLQYITCNADTTPLYTFGKFTAGDGQVHQCRSWSQLRDYATENTACFRDTVEGIPLGEHFGYCDDGDDGVMDFMDYV
ncbi:hypothetical protein N7456_000963 [Penicillium angulare]|uniref:Uncharacterized protein n=1 Tax=Penicillium angulare TaxID=116970 RepID=A0A9W9KSL4_9EURO|nr:hypothetical protein N7456_000963 [Penicillium angulare]